MNRDHLTLDTASRRQYMESMASGRRTTIVIPEEDESALRAAARAEGVSQSELIRRGIRAVTVAYRRDRPRPKTALFQLSKKEEEELLRGEVAFGDPDA